MVIFVPDHTQGHTHTHILGRNPLDKGSARHRDLYLTTQHSQETDTNSPAGFEPAIPASVPQNYALDRTVTATGVFSLFSFIQGEGKVAQTKFDNKQKLHIISKCLKILF
jgi:hypothetical protein